MSGQRNLNKDSTERARSASSGSFDDLDLGQPRKVRKANIYDAVAGTVTQAGLTRNITDVKASRQPLRPDEVLFKQSNAPVRYEETDYYFANEHLSGRQDLPSGDLLSAVHAYVSKLYSRTAGPETEKAWRCMDETALIAFGILMEEAAREVIGDTGDLAFTEAADEEEERAWANKDEAGMRKRRAQEPGRRDTERKDVDQREASVTSYDTSEYSTASSD
ncbi:hypothetical protein ACEQ8H_000157 [Pleosporales sp. CAS-2024a]